jgi:deoxyadenosine/deoxycytidine kinase
MIISLEGNIGAGKSTMLDHLKYVDNTIVVKEDIDAYTNLNGNLNILDKFYSNPDKYAFAFQTVCLASKVDKLESIMKSNPNAIIIMERSILSDRYMFADLLHKSGSIDDVEYEVYLYHYNRCQKYEPDLLLYLDVDVQTCHERIKIRNREGEQGITISYLTDLDRQMKIMLETRDYISISNISELRMIINRLERVS